MSIEKYCLTDDGEILDCYYDKEKTEMRCIYKEYGKWYIDHDKFGNGFCARLHSRIIAFANTKKELKEKWREKRK